MTSPQTPLDNLIDQARQARDNAGRILADEQRSRAETAAQLEALNRYRLEYARHLQAALKSGMDTARLDNYQAFLRSLDGAIERASRTLDEHGERITASRQHWQQRQRQLSSYDTLAARRRAHQHRLEQWRELRRNDEANTTVLAHRRLRQSTQE